MNNPRYTKYMAAAVLAAALAACSTDEPAPDKAKVVCFGVPSTQVVGWEAETRATRGDLPEIPAPVQAKPDNIGVWGFNDLSADPVFKNRKMIYRYGAEAADYADLIDLWDELEPGNEYPYENPEKWVPSTASVSSRYKFFAYSPYIATGNPDTDDVIAYQETFAGFESFVWHRLPKFGLTDCLVNKTVLNYTSTRTGGNPHQVLLMDHLYSRLRFCFILGPEFGELREIRVKSITVKDLPGDKLMLRNSFTLLPDLDASGNSQYSCSRRWEPEPGSWPAVSYTLALEKDLTTSPYYTDNAEHPVLDGDGGLLLNAGNREHYGYLPFGSLYMLPYSDLQQVQISVVYDVYDKEGVLLRKDDTVSNVITLGLSAYGTAPGEGIRVLQPGYYYDVRICIEPKYLFVLSDNDVCPDGTLTIP